MCALRVATPANELTRQAAAGRNVGFPRIDARDSAGRLGLEICIDATLQPTAMWCSSVEGISLLEQDRSGSLNRIPTAWRSQADV